MTLLNVLLWYLCFSKPPRHTAEIMDVPKETPESLETKATKLRTTYYKLFHEMQFRCTKNALMNYEQSEKYQIKAETSKFVTTVFTALSASGVLTAIAQKGQLLANKVGVAGLVGLPVCGFLELLGRNTSELVPSYFERAKKHAGAASGWMQMADTAKLMQVRMKMDPKYDMAILIKQHNDMLEKKEQISKEVLIPLDTHSSLQGDMEKIYKAMTKRQDMYHKFLELEAKNSADPAKKADDIYV